MIELESERNSELSARNKRANTVFVYLESERNSELLKSKYRYLCERIK